MSKLIGTAPDQVPVNGMLGTMAYVDASELNTKQEKLVSGTTLKTLNGESLLGSGDIPISVTTTWEDITGKPAVIAAGVDAAAARAAIGAAEEVGEILPDRGSQVYTESQYINKSMFGTATYVLVELWGGGASGDAFWVASGEASGGEGGAWDWCLMRVADLADSSPLVIGSGGAPVSAASGLTPRYGLAGGKSSFSGFEVGGGYGGTIVGAGAHMLFSGWTGGWGAGVGVTNANDPSVVRWFAGPGGSSIYGGGGGGSSSLRASGTSLYGGNGGAGAMLTATGSATSGSAPSGGGGGVRSNTAGVTVTSGAGAPGQAKFTWW